MKHTYTAQQQREYIVMTRKIGVEWLDVFAGDTDFYSTYYWELLTELWYNDKPVMVSDALRYMRSIKSPFTARKYLQKAIESKYIVEKRNPKDERSTLIELEPGMRKKLDAFFDVAIDNLMETCGKIKK